MPNSNDSNSSSRLRLVHDRNRRGRSLREESEAALREYENESAVADATDPESDTDPRITLPNVHVHMPPHPGSQHGGQRDPLMTLLTDSPKWLRIGIAMIVAIGGGAGVGRVFDLAFLWLKSKLGT